MKAMRIHRHDEAIYSTE